MLDLYEEFRNVIAALEAAGIEYALCGGLAVSVHTEPRATVDIDILISEKNCPDVVASLSPIGFIKHGSSMSFAAGEIVLRRFIKTAGTDHLILDLIFPSGPKSRTAFEGRIRKELADGQGLWIASKRGLITLKNLRGSPQDILDIENLEREL